LLFFMDHQPWISLQTSGIATLLAFVVAVLIARVRGGLGKPARFVLDAFFLLLLLLPSGVSIFIVRSLGFFVARALGGGAWLNSLIGLKLHVIAAVSVIYFCARMGFRKTSPALVEAARMQGFGPCGTFWRIEIPLAWHWLLAGLLIGFLRAFGESVFTLLPCVTR
jgi:molybdate transport system permease protein